METLVRADVSRHIDGFIERGSCDLAKELAEYVPAETICRLVGIDDHLIEEVRESALAMIASQGDPGDFAVKEAAFAAVVLPEVRARREHLRNDYLTYLSSVRLEGRALKDRDYIGLLIAFLGAGHHSTTSAMSSLMFEVFSRSDIRTLLTNDPEKIPVVVEKSLRLHPPIYGFFRQTRRAVEVSGVTIPAKSDVYMGWAAGNRDPKVFLEPCEFRPDRPNRAHLSFGHGIHVCPGATLARMELRVVVEELLRRISDLRIDLAEPVYALGGADFAYFPSLPASFTPGPKAP